MQFDMSYGVTKISVKAFNVSKIGGKSLAFYNNLSLLKLFHTEDILKFECQLYGEGKSYQASLYMQLKRDGDALPKYNIFAEMANRIKVNKEVFMLNNPDYVNVDQDG